MTLGSTAQSVLEDVVSWHDLECGRYVADLTTWRELALEAGGPVLELGCGTGRVTLDLAAQGHAVEGFDCAPPLVHALTVRARTRGLQVRCTVGDARSFELGREFGLIVAPMQVIQLMGGVGGRGAVLDSARRHLRMGGLFAAGLADPTEGLDPRTMAPPAPDAAELDGWRLESTPVAMRPVDPDGLAIERVRRAIRDGGDAAEGLDVVTLDRLTPSDLEDEATAAGFRPLSRRAVPATGAYVGTTVVVLEAR